MKTKILLSILSIFFITVCYSQSPNYIWAKQQNAGGTNDNFGSRITVDGNGNTIVLGGFKSPTITFGTTTLTNTDTNYYDIFIVKYDTNGNVLWAKQQDADGTGSDHGFDIGTDFNGNIIVTGSFNSPTITFGSTTLINANTGSAEVFIVKYDPNGNVLWAKQQDSGGISGEDIRSVTTDTNGNIIVTGAFGSPTITFGTTTLSNAGVNNDIFIVKFDPNGNVLWAKQQDSGGTFNEWGSDIVADVNGNIIVTGGFRSTLSFGSTTLINAGDHDIFIVKYDTNGNVLWAKQQDAGGTELDYGGSISVDASENIIFTGIFESSSITFGTTTLINAGFYDIFIVKYDPTGNVLWAKQQDSGGNWYEWWSSVTIDANENIILTGTFGSPTITFGTTTLSNAGVNSDIFIVKFDPNGNVLWSKQQDGGGIDNDASNGIAVDSNGNITIVGYFSSPTITFGTTTLSNTGDRNFFIAKLDATITGIIENTINQVSLYSNLTTGLIYLSNLYNVTLIDVTGKIIKIIQNTNIIDISVQPAGMYYLTLTDSKGEFVQRNKIVKK